MRLVPASKIKDDDAGSRWSVDSQKSISFAGGMGTNESQLHRSLFRGAQKWRELANRTWHKIVLLREAPTKGRGFVDLSDCPGFCYELLHWSLQRPMKDMFYVRSSDDPLYDFGEVCFGSQKDYEAFYNEFLPAFDRPVDVDQRYWMAAWPCFLEYDFNRRNKKENGELWSYELDLEENYFIFADQTADGMLTEEGIELWLALRNLPLTKPLYYWDKHFRNSNEADMILVAATLDEWQQTVKPW